MTGAMARADRPEGLPPRGHRPELRDHACATGASASDAKLEQVRALGYPERFIRMWDFYLAYCEGGFLERSIGDVQLLLAKPGARPKQFLPDLEAAL